MSELEKYLSAVALRKPKDNHGVVNHAILLQLVDKDVPLVSEMARVAHEGLTKILALGRKSPEEPHLTGETACEMLRLAEACRAHLLELAKSGSVAKWGA